MSLTTEQATIVRNYVNTDPVLSLLPPGTDSAIEISIALTNKYSPEFYVWKTKASIDDILSESFDFTLVDNLTVGKYRIWEVLFSNSSKSINPSNPAIRNGISACWVGSAPLIAQRNLILSSCYRKANILEKLLATGTGTTGSPATMTIEGEIGYQDVIAAMQWYS